MADFPKIRQDLWELWCNVVELLYLIVCQLQVVKSTSSGADIAVSVESVWRCRSLQNAVPPPGLEKNGCFFPGISFSAVAAGQGHSLVSPRQFSPGQFPADIVPAQVAEFSEKTAINRRICAPLSLRRGGAAE